ncbi:unnamed protein product [Hymenolepis diminuta]|uniref:Uncharacterized protein n=1 Tax=Hymenolepis diminuta TaxID=6216 RepID=A0A564YBP3_HYMDI|nr:unnamed protein product [Hymenolepis diminuta]
MFKGPHQYLGFGQRLQVSLLSISWQIIYTVQQPASHPPSQVVAPSLFLLAKSTIVFSNLFCLCPSIDCYPLIVWGVVNGVVFTKKEQIKDLSDTNRVSPSGSSSSIGKAKCTSEDSCRDTVESATGKNSLSTHADTH